MPKVISVLQRVHVVHSTDYHFKKGIIWKPISETDVNSLSQGSQCDDVLASPFSPNRCPQEQSPSGTVCKADLARYITDAASANRVL